MPSRKDVALGRVPPKTVERGVVVPPLLQVNEMTLEEHQARLRMIGKPRLDVHEIARIHPGE